MKAKARAAWHLIKGDGCTGAPDMTFTSCCTDHDRHYTTHTHASGAPITRARADAAFLQCCKRHAPPIPVLGPLIPYLYWLAVRLFGGAFWRKSKKHI